MKKLLNNDNENNILSDLDSLYLDYVDRDKLSLFSQNISPGIRNFIRFQKFTYFKWPYWLYNAYSIDSQTFNPISPFLLQNNNRNWISFSSRNSSIRVQIDPAGMISPFNDTWSIEFWIYEKDTLYRPQERLSPVIQRDLETFMVNIKWKELNFEFNESIYGVKDNYEELIVELKSYIQKNITPLWLLIAVRPYNTLSLGGIESIEFNNKTRLIRINGHDRIYLEIKPDYILSGNGTLGDIDINRVNKKTADIKCKSGMATLAFAYSLNKGNNEHAIRIGLENRKNIHPVKINYSKYKNEYIERSKFQLKKGFKLSFPDKLFQKWVYGAKKSALNFLDDDISKAMKSYNADSKALFYIISGYNRMGLFSESLKIINFAAEDIDHKEKLSLSNILGRCYVIIAASDYFKLSRDIEYIKLKYHIFRELIHPVLQYSGSIKEKNRKHNINSIENYCIAEYRVYDTIIISYSLFEFSYLARCLGIFNDEVKFNKESSRLEKLIIDEIDDFIEKDDGIKDHKDEEKENNLASPQDASQDAEQDAPGEIKFRNEYFAYDVFAGYPFRVQSLSLEKLKLITQRISDHFSENPVYFKSAGGSDIFFSIIYAINLLLVKDIRVHAIIGKLFKFGKDKYTLQDFVNPKTGCGLRGEGDSVICASVFLTLLRSVIFMDSQEMLELFPVPKEEWFTEGSEIKIEDAPSIFGQISFRVLSTGNEVQFYFNELPKYIPPNMMINLPFKVRIKHEDDFILKKETGNSFLLHGWPSIIRFIRR